MAISRKFRRTLAVGTALTALVLGGIGISQFAFAATLLSDDFSDGNSSDWSKSGGDWSVVTDGSLALRQSKLDSELARQFAGSTSWTNYTAQARVKPIAWDGTGSFSGLAARSSGSTSFDRIVLLNTGQAQLQAVRSGTVTVLGTASVGATAGTWYTLRLVVSGSTVTGFVNSTQVGSGASQSTTGRIGLLTNHATASFDDVSVTDGATTPPTGNPTNPPTGNPTNPPTTNPTTPPTSVPPTTGLVGWATQNGGTTGGGSGSTVTVTSSSALDTALQSSSAMNIRISGMISISGMHRVASNKTITGVGSGSGITGGGLTLSGVRNVIIRNLNFRNAGDDSINVETNTTNVWIDHNDLSNGYDGLIDIKRGSDFITVSYNKLHDHDKSMLLGHDDGNGSQDIGHLRVTYHHNWFEGTGQRHPRVRFGNPVHVYNNYYHNIGSYGVASTENAGVLVESNYFENVEDPWHRGEGDSSAGSIVARNNYLVNSGSGDAGGSVASIPYSYSAQTASTVKGTVTAGAGVGKIGL